jgi:hypothetical protein
MQHEKIVEFKRKMGHCVVPFECAQHASLGIWVSSQRKHHNNNNNNNELRLDRKEPLEEIGFTRKDDGTHTLNQNNELWHQHVWLVVFSPCCGVGTSFQRGTP